MLTKMFDSFEQGRPEWQYLDSGDDTSCHFFSIPTKLKFKDNIIKTGSIAEFAHVLAHFAHKF